MRARARDPLAEAVLRLEGFDRRPSRRRPSPRSFAGVTSRPPCRSARLTTPIGSEVQAPMQALHVDPVVQRAAPRPPQARQIEPDQLRAAAADVEHQRPVAIAVDQRGAAGDGELRLGLLRHDLDGESGLALHARR